MKKTSIFLIVLILILSIPSMIMAEDSQITRGEFIKKVIDEMEVEITKDRNYIDEAREYGLLKGDKEFNKNETIIKEDAIVILAKAFGERVGVKKLSRDTIDNTLRFTDESSINPENKEYVAYALISKIVDEDDNSLYPKLILDEKMAKQMIKTAQKTYKDKFEREGLDASEMIVLAEDTLKEHNTYKAKGNLLMNMKMNIEGLSDSEELEQQLSNNKTNIKMNIGLDMEVQNPDKIYIKEEIKTDDLVQEEANQNIEIFMDKTTMYQKMPQSGDKWIKNDMTSIYKQLESLKNSSPENSFQLSDEQLKFFKNYASYVEDEVIEGKEYYVINMNIDKETYKEYFDKYTKEIMKTTMEQQLKDGNLEENKQVSLDMTMQMIEQMIGKMDIEANYKYYINKQTKEYYKTYVSQKIYISMDNLLRMMEGLAQNSNEEVDLSKVKFEMINHTEGEIYYYDHDEDVVFPQIKPEDILDIKDIQQIQNVN